MANDAQRPKPGFDRRAIPAVAREQVWSAPDGWPIRRIDWQGNDERGCLLFVAGRGDAYEKYLETLDGWASVGWRVTALDWRGQAGSGRLGTDEVTGHVADFGVWLGDLQAFWETWSASAPGPRVLVGHSMGGHLALRAVAEGRIDPDALVLSAPMLGFAGPPVPPGLLHTVARGLAALGDSRRPAWRWSERPGEPPAERITLLTHDAVRYQDELWWRERRPALAMGPASWGWVASALASIRALFRPGMLEAVEVPTLILGVKGDRLVDYRAIERAARRLPRAELVRFGSESRHEVLREVDPVRDRALAAIAEFLNRVVPPNAE